MGVGVVYPIEEACDSEERIYRGEGKDVVAGLKDLGEGICCRSVGVVVVKVGGVGIWHTTEIVVVLK